MNFSQRIGIQPKQKPLQMNCMDDDLRNGLWNSFFRVFVERMQPSWDTNGDQFAYSPFAAFFTELWEEFFKLPLDQMPGGSQTFCQFLRKWFFEAATPWNRRYDFIEFAAQQNAPMPTAEFPALCNAMLERESSAYRFVGKQIAPITNEHEIAAVEEAEGWDDGPLAPSSQHVRASVKFLSDRDGPDYRNSIKESISAVESVCKLLADAPGDTLTPALKKLAAKVSIHDKMVQGFKSLYGYTSDADGIRHGLLDASKSDFEDAKYMLVSCSAFVNYLVGKAVKAEILTSS